MRKNCLKIWTKLIEVDRELHAQAKSSYHLEDWIAIESRRILGRKVSPESAMLISRDELQKILSMHRGPWHDTMSNLLRELGD